MHMDFVIYISSIHIYITSLLVHCMPCDLSDVRSHFILELCDVVETGMPLVHHELFWSLVPLKYQSSPILNHIPFAQCNVQSLAIA